MLYGEVFASEIDPPCGEEGHPPCITGNLESSSLSLLSLSLIFNDRFFCYLSHDTR